MASGSEGLFSLECAFPANGSIRRSIGAKIWNIVSPFFSAFAIVTIFAIHGAVKKREWGDVLLNFKVAILSVFYISYISLSHNLLKMFNCTRADSSNPASLDNEIATSRYWMEDTSIECYKGSHAMLVGFFGVPVLLAVTFGMPIWLLLTLTCRKGHLEEDLVLKTYGFLYQSYDDRFEFWEVTIMARKALLAAIAVFTISLGSNLQATLGLAVLFTAFGAHVMKKPFTSKGPHLDRMEGTSLACSIFAFFTALVFMDPKTSNAGRVVVSVVFILAMTAQLTYLLMGLFLELSKGVNRFLMDANMSIDGDTTLLMKVNFLRRHLKAKLSEKSQKLLSRANRAPVSRDVEMN